MTPIMTKTVQRGRRKRRTSTLPPEVMSALYKAQCDCTLERIRQIRALVSPSKAKTYSVIEEAVLNAEERSKQEKIAHDIERALESLLIASIETPSPNLKSIAS